MKYAHLCDFRTFHTRRDLATRSLQRSINCLRSDRARLLHGDMFASRTACSPVVRCLRLVSSKRILYRKRQSQTLSCLETLAS